MPCAPFGGSQSACSRCRRSGPASGSSSSTATPNYPVWTGCWWGSATRSPRSGWLRRTRR
jgi:hypothetical protein